MVVADVLLRSQLQGGQASLPQLRPVGLNLGFLPARSLLWWFRVEKHFPFCSKLRSNCRSFWVKVSSDHGAAATVDLWHSIGCAEIMEGKIAGFLKRYPETIMHICMWLSYSCSKVMVYCQFGKTLSRLGRLHKNNK